MTQCRLWVSMAEKSFRDRRRISYMDIHTQTRIAKSVLSRLGNDRAEIVACRLSTGCSTTSIANPETFSCLCRNGRYKADGLPIGDGVMA